MAELLKICLIGAIVLAVSAFVSKWLFEIVMASDLPNWAKYLILR